MRRSRHCSKWCWLACNITMGVGGSSRCAAARCRDLIALSETGIAQAMPLLAFRDPCMSGIIESPKGGKKETVMMSRKI